MCWDTKLVSSVQPVAAPTPMASIERTIFVKTDPIVRRNEMCEYFCNVILTDSLGKIAVKLRWAADEWGANSKRVVELAEQCMRQVDMLDTPTPVPEWVFTLQCPHWDLSHRSGCQLRHNHKVKRSTCTMKQLNK